MDKTPLQVIAEIRELLSNNLGPLNSAQNNIVISIDYALRALNFELAPKDD